MFFKKYIVILLSALPLLFVACEKKLNIPLPEHDAKLVINSYLNPGSPLDVYVSRSFGLLENRDQDYRIKDAVVELFEGDESLGMLTYRDTVVLDSLIYFQPGSDTAFVLEVKELKLGKYSSENIEILPAKSYRVEVAHPTYGKVSSVTKTVSAPEISNVELEQNVVRQLEFDYDVFQSLLKVEVKDSPGEENYYRFELEIEFSESSFPEDVFMERVEVSGPAIQAENGYKVETQWLTDAGKDGQMIRAELLAYLPNSYAPSNEIEKLDIKTLILKVYSANKDTYTYMDKLSKQREAGDDFSIFPSEAIVVYSNIENGYGIFGGLTSKTYKISQ